MKRRRKTPTERKVQEQLQAALDAMRTARRECQEAAMFSRPRQHYPLTVQLLRTAIETADALSQLMDKVVPAIDAEVEGAAEELG